MPIFIVGRPPAPGGKDNFLGFRPQRETLTVDFKYQTVAEKLALAHEIIFDAGISGFRYESTFLDLLKSRDLSHVDQ